MNIVETAAGDLLTSSSSSFDDSNLSTTPTASVKGQSTGGKSSRGEKKLGAMESSSGCKLLCECATALVLLLSQGLSGRCAANANKAEEKNEPDQDEDDDDDGDAPTTAVIGALSGLTVHPSTEVALVAVRSLKDVASCLSHGANQGLRLCIAHVRQVRVFENHGVSCIEVET
jgi:hypothetical protein